MEIHVTANGSLGGDSIKELQKYIFSPRFNRFMYGWIIFFAVMGLLFLALKSVNLFFINMGAAISLLVAKIYGFRWTFHRVINSMKKNNPQDILYNLYFYDDFLSIGAEAEVGFKIYYRNIKRVAETERLFGLFLKGDMCLPVFKDSISDNGKLEWLDLIFAQNKKVVLQLRK